MSQWYAVRSATCREEPAAKALREAGVTVFLPMEARWGSRPGQIGRVRLERPLIRGYLFVLMEPTDERRVLDVEGVHAFLGYSDEEGSVRPLPIPLAMIIELQADERAGRYDRTLHVKTKYRPKKGDRVRVLAGPWLSFFGKVIATPRGDRTHLMIEGPHGRGVVIDAKHLNTAA
jgi:transcription antitermination factor NusG